MTRTTPTPEDALVRLVLQAAQGVMRARRVGADDPVLHEAEAALQTAFGPVWERLPRIDLEVAPAAIRFDEADALVGGDDAEGFIDTLRRAGIRSLVLHPGAELEEIKLVLAIVVAARGGTDGSGLLTSLFRADLHHVQYEVEPVAEESSRPAATEPARIDSAREPPRVSAESVRETVREDASVATDSGVVRLEKFDSTLYFLDAREIEYLKSAIDREYSQDQALNALAVLLDILEMVPDPGIRQEVVGILSDFLPELLGEGRFEAVASLVSGIREAARVATELTVSQKDSLDRLRSSVSSPKALSQLFFALEGGAVVPTARSMDVLLRELRPAAVREVLRWGEKLTDTTTRTAVVQALDTFFTEWPHGLSRMLNASERDVVGAGLDLAARLKLPELVDIVGEIASHEDPGIRRHVAETFAAMATVEALRGLLGMADDPDRDVRVVVYETFAQRPARGAFSTLKRALTETDVESRGEREKRVLFEALGGAAGPDGVGVLEPLLKGRNPHGRRPSSHTRACAAIGLGIIGTPGARSVLKGFTNDRDPLVRSAASAALRGET